MKGEVQDSQDNTISKMFMHIIFVQACIYLYLDKHLTKI